ncbi:MAG TPA: YdeI/OmpD-associated family protein [Acidimicrobiales bacterium]|nr:YdeI/OmpD-associated family protein [Acidimicrobiales bacterium]
MISFATAAEWETWLADSHAAAAGVWLKLAKKNSGVPSVTYAEAVEVALCYGWIDGQTKKVDDVYWVQRFTPRTARSKWSKINCGKATALIDRGAMKPAGLREVERAKADGRWEAAYDGQRTATIPDDLQTALDGNVAAREFFSTLDSHNRYAILHRIADAKKAETRARRIDTFVSMLSRGEKIHA